MAFKNVGTYNLDKAVSGSAGAANVADIFCDVDDSHRLCVLFKRAIF